MFSFILVKRKTTDSEFKYCCGDYQLCKTKQREERESVSYTKLFSSSQLKKKKSLLNHFQSVPITLLGFGWKGKILHMNEVMIQELAF